MTHDLVASLPAFLVAVLFIASSPGPAIALILRRAALRGFRGAVPTVLGLEAGLYLWALAAAAGLATLVAASEVAYMVLRVVGAVVLIVLGARALRGALSAGEEAADVLARARPTRRGWWAAFAEGVVVQLANPKAAVFMLAFYPQFVPAGRPLFATTAALALIQVIVEVALYLALAAGVSHASGWLGRPAVRRRLEGISGAVLIALGLRVATSAR